MPFTTQLSLTISWKSIGVLACAAILLAACEVTSHELVGAARAPIDTGAVRLFLEPPRGPYEAIAIVHASSARSWTLSSQGQADVVVRRLKEEAAKLGANGVLLRGITDEPGPALGADAGAQYQGPRGTVDLGIGGSGFLHKRFGRAIAVYIDSAAQ